MTRMLTIANNSNWFAETVDLVIRKADGTTDVRMLEAGHETNIIDLNPGDVLEVHPSVDNLQPYGYRGRQHPWHELPQAVPVKVETADLAQGIAASDAGEYPPNPPLDISPPLHVRGHTADEGLQHHLHPHIHQGERTVEHHHNIGAATLTEHHNDSAYHGAAVNGEPDLPAPRVYAEGETVVVG